MRQRLLIVILAASFPMSIASAAGILSPLRLPKALFPTALHTLSCTFGDSGTADLGRGMGFETSSEAPK